MRHALQTVLKAAMSALLLAMTMSYALAVNPDEVLKDPALESRAREISSSVRCLVCQNESVDDSNADLAKDLRLLIRERLTQGDTDEEVFAFLVSRYGEYVLLKPTFSAKNLLLWLLPVLLLAGAGGVLVAKSRTKAAKVRTEELSAEEKNRLQQILDRE